MVSARNLRYFFVFMILLLSGVISPAQAQGQSSTPGSVVGFLYLSPSPNTKFASAGTTIVLRHAEALDPASATTALYRVTGSASGVHTGSVTTAPDGHTVFFRPDRTFTPGEQVIVTVQAGLRTVHGDSLAGTTWTFGVSSQPYPYATASAQDYAAKAYPSRTVSPVAATTAGTIPSAASVSDSTVQTYTLPNYKTVPPQLPRITMTSTGLPLDPGYLFFAPFSWVPVPARGQYTLIVDDTAELIYYERRNTEITFDFKVQPNGYLSYFASGNRAYHILDNKYRQVGVYRAGNGLNTDEHDFQLLPNGHGLLMSYVPITYDLSAYGGPTDATLVYLVIQEVDQDQNVYFEWNSLDHIALTDTNMSLAASYVDYVHGNAVELDTDGHILLSSRHLSEITKINRTTGDVIWRLGGKQNQFVFDGDATLPNVGAFSYQHDIRRLPNGNISLFDNGNDFINAGLARSRGVEYQIDEVNKTATRVREFRSVPEVVSLYMGNFQVLESGNTLVGWGGGFFAPMSAPREAITEFTQDGQVALAVDYGDSLLVSYRAFRFPWQAVPDYPPTLVAITNTLPISLYYSWNGATEVVSYTVAGGVTPDALTAFTVQPKTGFEETTPAAAAPEGSCFFRVTPYDKNGLPNLASNVVYLGDALCPTHLTAPATEASSRALPLATAIGPVTVTLAVEAGAVPTATIFVLAPGPQLTTTLPPGKIWGGLEFALSLYNTDTLSQPVAATAMLNTPVQLTIDYRNVPAPHLTSLHLVAWDEAQGVWTGDGVTVLANDTLRRQLTAAVARGGVFALLAENATPESSNNTVAWTDEDTPYTFQRGNFPYYDADGDPLQAIVVEAVPPLGTLALGETVVSSGQVIPVGAIAQLLFTPAPDDNGIPYTAFRFRVSDGFAASLPYSSTILVRPVNDAPVAVDDLLVIPGLQDKERASTAVAPPAQLDVLRNDTDVDGDRLRLAGVTAPEHGTAAIVENQVVYTPQLGYKGADTFTYTVTDDRGAQATATVTVTGAAQRLFLPHIQTQQGVALP